MLIQSAKTQDERLVFLKALNKTLISGLGYGWDWTDIVRILADWAAEHGSRPTDAGSAEIVNLILVCLSKMPITESALSRTDVFFYLAS